MPNCLKCQAYSPLTGEANSAFLVEWDHLNKITSVHGCNFINTTGNIIIQEFQPGCDASISM